MDGWNLDENNLVNDNKLQHRKSIMPKVFLQGLTYNVRYTFSVGWHYTGGVQLVMSITNIIGDTKYRM